AGREFGADCLGQLIQWDRRTDGRAERLGAASNADPQGRGKRHMRLWVEALRVEKGQVGAANGALPHAELVLVRDELDRLSFFIDKPHALLRRAIYLLSSIF